MCIYYRVVAPPPECIQWQEADKPKSLNRYTIYTTNNGDIDIFS